MRVLYLANASHIAGGNRFLLSLWEALRPEGVEPFAVCPDDGPMVATTRETGVPCEVIPFDQPGKFNPIHTWRNHRRWAKHLRDVKPDLIHANGFEPARSICTAALAAGIPLINHVHFERNDNYQRWVYKHLPKPAAFVYCSQATMERTSPGLRDTCPGASHHVLYNAVRLDQFSPRTDKRDGPLRVGKVASLIARKRHEDFLDMAGQLTAEGIDAEYWMIGEDIEGDRLDGLKAKAAELQLGERANFMGYRSDVAQLLPELDVLVLCADHEELPISLIEASACGVPVVATDVGGVSEIVVDGETGFLVPTRSPDRLAECTGKLLRDADLRARMGQAARERSLELFSIESQVKQALALYGDVAGRQADKRCAS